MKFVIAVDCEGPAGVVGAPGGSLNDAPTQYEFARRQATAEASAAARGLFAAGAKQVIVWDTHGGGVNLVYEELDERCDIFHGANGGRLSMLDRSFSGLLFIGYHARDNTLAAPLAHTFSSARYQWIKINGREIGEMTVDAAVAGALGVPVLFVASDDKAVAVARIENHYFRNKCWLEDGQLLRDAPRLAGIPGIIVQGRHDCCTAAAR